MKSLQDKYNLIKEGKGNKETFLKEAKTMYPNVVTNVLTFDQAIHNLTERGIILEGFIGVSAQKPTEPNWFKIFNENVDVKANLKQTDKAVVEKEIAGYNYEDKKNNNNISTAELLTGYYLEMKDPKNAEKTESEIKAMVFKNLEKDPLHYVKNGQFGVKDLGYKEEAPGLGKTKEVKGKYKSSGLEPVKLSESKHSNEADLKIYKSELNLINKVKAKGEKHEKRKAELEKNIADLESKMTEGIHDRDILSRPLSNPYTEPLKRSPEELGREADSGSENILRMKYYREINDPNITDDELRYILGGKGVKGFGGRPNAIEKIISSRNISETDITGIAGSEDEEDYKKGAKGLKKENTKGLKKDVTFNYTFDELLYNGDYYNIEATIEADVDLGIDEDVSWHIESIDSAEKHDKGLDKWRPVQLTPGQIEEINSIVTDKYYYDVADEAVKLASGEEDVYDKGGLAEDDKPKKKILPNKQKGVADAIVAKSTLEKIANAVWNERDLNKAKDIVKQHVETSGMNDTSKKQILYNISTITTKSKLDFYIANALLKYEKLSVNESTITEGYGDSLEDAMKRAYEHSLDGYVQHVEDNGDGTFSVTDWYDDEKTVVSFEDGRKFNDHTAQFQSDYMKRRSSFGETLAEAKKRAIEKHLKEIEKLSEVAAMDHKIQKIQEKIEELKNKITMTEGDDLAEMVDKNAVKEIKKDIAFLERRKKMYETQKGRLAKKVSGQGKPQTHAGGGYETGMMESKKKDEMFLDAVFKTLNDKMRANELSNQEFNSAARYLNKHGHSLLQTSGEPKDIAELIIRKVTGMTESKEEEEGKKAQDMARNAMKRSIGLSGKPKSWEETVQAVLAARNVKK